MGGVACNGWRFWSREGNEPAPSPSAPKLRKATGKTEARAGSGAKKAQQERNGGHGGGHPLLHPAAIQEGVAAGETAWFCDACMATFTVAAREAPESCPEGHRADDPQLAAVS